jgi:CRP-like cAMP-binding protein
VALGWREAFIVAVAVPIVFLTASYTDPADERFALLFKYVAQARGLAPEEWLRERLAGIIHLQRMQRPVQDAATITISQSELANMVGLSRQTLSGLLASLQAREVIEVSYRTIRLLK